MAGSINKVILVGNLGKDPEVRALQNGSEVCNLTVATSESWKDKATGERKEKTEWHKVVIFNDNLARIAKEYLHKGSKVYLEGQLQTRKWTNKEGQDQYSTEVALQNFNGTLVLLDGKKQESESGKSSENNVEKEKKREYKVDSEFDDEIPFGWAITIGVLGLMMLQSMGVA